MAGPFLGAESPERKVVGAPEVPADSEEDPEGAPGEGESPVDGEDAATGELK